MKRYWLTAALPVLLGIFFRIILAREILPNPKVFFRADLGSAILIIGVFFSIVLALVFVGREWLEQKHHLELEILREETAANRRRFLQRLDHELKNPLTAIRAGLANLGDRTNLEALESVQAQTLRMSRLVSDLRKLADLETRPLERSSVPLSEILTTVVEVAREDPSTGGRQISLSLPQAPWPLPEIMGDYDLLLLAMHNLVHNALKFSNWEDTIEVRSFEDGANVVVEVADTGQGIPNDELPFVWQELYRGKGARGVPGSGLGLALVRAIIDLHHGEIAIRSRVDQGTVITLRLPVTNL